MSTVSFFAPGIPGPQGSKAYVGHHNRRLANGETKALPVLKESSAKVGPWREIVALLARQKFRNPIDGPVRVEVEFILPRPKSIPKRVVHMVKKPDLDKLIRSTLDALSKIAYADDNRVTEITASKRYATTGERTGASITITPSTKDQP